MHQTVHHRQDGFKAHVAIEPDTGLFTAGELAQASGADHHEAVVGLDLLEHDPQPGPFEVLADAAYGTGEARAALAAAGHLPVITPVPLRPAVTGGFTTDAFTVDEAAGTVTCPAGITRRIPPSRGVTFGAACRSCPLRHRCTTAKHGRSLTLHNHDAVLRAARRDWAEHADLRATYRQHRPMVERSIAWLIGPKGRCRTLRYRGVATNHWWLHTRMAALNLRRLLTLGLHHQHDHWTLAPTG